MFGGNVSLDNSLRTGRVIGAGRRRTAPAAAAVLMLGAALVLASAAIHLHLWATGYRHIGTIGPLFFAQGALGIALGILVALVRRPFIALITALFALGTVVGLLLASHGGLFGYRTTMHAPWATTALSIEVAAVVLLCLGSTLAVSAERTHARYMRSFKSTEL
ncbi:MAG: hypothetical protein ABSG36_10570 [Acidimicrobiales bacterium]|jgi:hypothetical protein